MTRSKPDILPEYKKEPLEDVDPEFNDLNGIERLERSMMECICPKCGQMHIMKIRWMGRGIPRKFCRNCRDRAGWLDDRFRR